MAIVVLKVAAVVYVMIGMVFMFLIKIGTDSIMKHGGGIIKTGAFIYACVFSILGWPYVVYKIITMTKKYTLNEISDATIEASKKSDKFIHED